MLKITLKEPFRAPFTLRFGYDSVTPMDMGPRTDQVTNEARGQRHPSGAKPRLWEMDFNSDAKSILVPNEVAVHYFGDWRAGTDLDAVDKGLIPNFNDERERVANAWGGYFLSDKHGMYATVKIAVPQIPKVVIQAVNDSGSVVGDFKFEPHKFFRFEEPLAPSADAEMAEILSRGKVNMKFDLSQIPQSQLDELAALLANRKTPAGAK